MTLDNVIFPVEFVLIHPVEDDFFVSILAMLAL